MKISICAPFCCLVILSILVRLESFRTSKSDIQYRQKRSRLDCAANKLIVGLNKYSHDASCCVIDASNGKILFAQAKERITRKKHDGGGTGDVLQFALDYLCADTADVALVVSNNHHFRVQPFEQRLPFAAAINYVPKTYLSSQNLLPDATHLELSHHLAHAYGAAGSCPYEEALIVCMDGMGESYRAMADDLVAHPDAASSAYTHDLRLLRGLAAEERDAFLGQPRVLQPGAGYREAETAYVLGMRPSSPGGPARRGLRPVFKRWASERSPPELQNHGFENMDSLGASLLASFPRHFSHLFTLSLTPDVALLCRRRVLARVVAPAGRLERVRQGDGAGSLGRTLRRGSARVGGRRGEGRGGAGDGGSGARVPPSHPADERRPLSGFLHSALGYARGPAARQ